ncbi:DEAD/DEAH box helicase [Pseudomonas thivervalensis]|uniref:Type III restriction endonuclease subunit R n=1 Tax=Pseudomonas thivervalensis TaxID=86265 RepID=A0A2Z4ZZK0_9PSED|nr:DEAD/DEAH box helicase family protein [Pseudomonas thivervalensis]AXA58223.1 type III restriction endonuclease subunit R [Pseudomonas thivervalensis]AXA63935.1 type III restriction endonuclease subunit R [Pseudomonas thivervalensis]
MDILEYLESAKGKLRSCQLEAVRSFVAYAEENESNRALLINLPTGAGKTGVISLISHLSKASKILVICHRKAVKDQLFREISKKFFRITIKDEDFNLKKTYRDYNFEQGEGIYITSFQKLTVLGDEELENVQKDFDLIIVDEGHSEPSPVWREIIRQSSAMKVVITATPYRNDLFELNVSTEHFYVFTFKDAVADGVITEPLYEQIVDEPRLLKRIKDYLDADASLKCIVKCKSLEEIQKYHGLLSPLFITASVHERLEIDEAQNKFKRVGPALKLERLRIIIHQHKLDEGIDIPEAKLLVLTYELGSGRELVQAVGRIVRHYGEAQPLVLDLSRAANEGMWEGYLKFDDYLASGGASEFVSSLSTTYLIESFLESFPKYSYFDGKFKERVDLNQLNPEDDLKIPNASVCFVQKEENFSLPLLTDRLYWELHGAGALVKTYEDVLDLKVMVYVEFNSSKFFSNKLFFEPKLHVIILKEMESGVAVFDSGGGRYYNQEKYRLRNAIHIDKLTALAAKTKIHQIKETHARAIGQAVRRPESVALKGQDLDGSRSNQSNSRYALTMVKVDNIGLDGKKDSSFYIGARSGRVVDQKESNFTLYDISQWIDAISECIEAGGNAGHLIKSYAQPIADKPDTEILSVLLDFTELDGPKPIGHGEIHAEFLYVDYSDGVSFNAHGETIELALIYLDDASCFEVELCGASDGRDDHEWVVEYLNNGHRLKILYEDGVTYLGGTFYKLALPYERGIAAQDSFSGNSLFPLVEMLGPNLKEKGHVKKHQYHRTTRDSFDPDSIFHLVDKLKGYGDPATPLGDLGPFAKYIPGCDLVLCCDMGVEPADFILSSPDKLCFVHVKCGAARRPKSSAGAIAEVGSQAIKNIHMLVSSDKKFKPGNFSTWHQAWPANTAVFPLSTRYRLVDGRINYPAPADDSLSKRVWELICTRRVSMRCKKEIWIVAGNSFSAKHYIKSMENPLACQPASIQAYQLIEDWLSTADELDVDLKIFTAP